VINRLLYKGALEAVGPSNTLFLALLQASAPAAAYAAVLAYRVATGRVTRADLACVDGVTAAVIGAGEAASSTLGFVAATRLPGAALPMLAQSMLVWQLLIDRVVLGRRVSAARGVGAGLVVAGVVAGVRREGRGNERGARPHHAPNASTRSLSLSSRLAPRRRRRRHPPRPRRPVCGRPAVPRRRRPGQAGHL